MSREDFYLMTIVEPVAFTNAYTSDENSPSGLIYRVGLFATHYWFNTLR